MKIKLVVSNHQIDSSLYLWQNAYCGDLQAKKRVWSYIHRMFLLRNGVTKQHGHGL